MVLKEEFALPKTGAVEETRAGDFFANRRPCARQTRPLARINTKENYDACRRTASERRIFANGAISGAMTFVLNTMHHSQRNQQSFTPADLDELKARLGWQKGKALVFTGKRPLAGKSDVFLDGSATDPVNLEGLHEQVFMIDEAGALHDIGFFNGPGPIGGAFSGGTVRPDSTASFTDYTFSKKSIFWRSIPVQSPDPILRHLRLSQTRTNWNWTINQLKPQFTDQYNLIMCNCQDFSTGFRAYSKNWK